AMGSVHERGLRGGETEQAERGGGERRPDDPSASCRLREPERAPHGVRATRPERERPQRGDGRERDERPVRRQERHQYPEPGMPAPAPWRPVLPRPEPWPAPTRVPWAAVSRSKSSRSNFARSFAGSARTASVKSDTASSTWLSPVPVAKPLKPRMPRSVSACE